MSVIAKPGMYCYAKEEDVIVYRFIRLFEEYTYFLYPLKKNDKHLQRWFVGEYRDIGPIIIKHIKNNNIDKFLIFEIHPNLYYNIYKRPTRIDDIDVLRQPKPPFLITIPIVDGTTTRKLHIRKLFKFKNFDKNLIPENIKRLIVETL